MPRAYGGEIGARISRVRRKRHPATTMSEAGQRHQVNIYRAVLDGKHEKEQGDRHRGEAEERTPGKGTKTT